MLELDDINALSNRGVTVIRYRELLKDAFDTLYRDGEQNGRLMVLNLHPWLIGQPFRIGYLDDALSHMLPTTGGVGRHGIRDNRPGSGAIRHRTSRKHKIRKISLEDPSTSPTSSRLSIKSELTTNRRGASDVRGELVESPL